MGMFDRIKKISSKVASATKRVLRRPGREAEKPEAPKAPPAEAPPQPPTAPPAAPPAPEEGPAEGPAEAPAEEGGAEEAPEKDYSDAPSSVDVRIGGTWQMSQKKWVGVVRGTLSGSGVVEFLRALDENREEEAVMMACEAFDQGSGFASAVDLSRSSWGSIDY